MHNPASRFLPLSSFGMRIRESDPRFQQNFRGNGSAASRRLGVKPRVSFGYRSGIVSVSVSVPYDCCLMLLH